MSISATRAAGVHLVGALAVQSVRGDKGGFEWDPGALRYGGGLGLQVNVQARL